MIESGDESGVPVNFTDWLLGGHVVVLCTPPLQVWVLEPLHSIF